MAKECKFLVNYTRMSCVSTLKCTGFEWQTSNAASSASVIQLAKKNLHLSVGYSNRIPKMTPPMKPKSIVSSRQARAAYKMF